MIFLDKDTFESSIQDIKRDEDWFRCPLSGPNDLYWERVSHDLNSERTDSYFNIN